MSRPDDIETPSLVLDVDRLDRNITAMAESTGRAGLMLRPHAKTHKCLEIASRQLAAGAAGLTVATVAEAELFSAAGCDDLFIAYPVWAAGQRGRRLHAVAERVALRVGVDSAEGAMTLAPALAGTGAEVLVEVDSGHHRTGVAPAEAGSVAVAAARVGLEVAGVFTFPGHGYGPNRRAQAAKDEADALERAARSVERAGIDVRVRSGGSTPTVAAADPGVLTEVRPGVYVFNDAQQAELGTCGWPDIALTAAATVVSRRGQQIVLDAGSKVLGADQPGWVTGGGRLLDHLDARISALSEHHATVVFPDGYAVPPLGERLRVAPNHVCAAVNLVTEMIVESAGEIIDRWSIVARGANT